MKQQTIKSLWRSAPFWKTTSGIKTDGLPEADRVTGARRDRVLSSNCRILSTREGFGGVGWVLLPCTSGGVARNGVDNGYVCFSSKEGEGEFETPVLGLEGRFEALFVWRGELGLGGRVVRFSIVGFVSVVVTDLGRSDLVSETEEGSTQSISVSVGETSRLTVEGEVVKRALVLEEGEAKARAVGLFGEREG